MAPEAAGLAQHATAIGNAITRIHREHYGRGATTTRTIVHRNHVITFLEDIYTPVERTLIEAGQTDAVKETRQIFQMAMRQKFVEAVQQVTGRTVIQFMSQVSFEPDIAVEVFVLAPTAGDPSSDGSAPAPSVDGRSSI
jgi:uncharacterized protein YbcI